ncbi:hypothetical protein GCM10009834_08280 [Streptomonospora arabica]
MGLRRSQERPPDAPDRPDRLNRPVSARSEPPRCGRGRSAPSRAAGAAREGARSGGRGCATAHGGVAAASRASGIHHVAGQGGVGAGGVRTRVSGARAQSLWT